MNSPKIIIFKCRRKDTAKIYYYNKKTYALKEYNKNI